MDISSIILSISTVVFGGTTLIQWFSIKDLKRKATYEADSSKIENLGKIIERQEAMIEHQSQQYSLLETKYNDLSQKYDALAAKYEALREAINSK